MPDKQTIEDVTYRACTPADVEDAVPLIYASGPAAFSYVFKNKEVDALDFLTYAFQRRGGEFSFDNHLALIVGEELVGVGAVFNQKQASKFTFADFLNIVGFYKWKSIPVLVRGLRIERVIRLPMKQEICLAHLGINPHKRGLGLGRKLISQLQKISKPGAGDVFVLDVSAENPRAQALYERLGFELVKCAYSSLKNKHGHVANHFRMQLPSRDLLRMKTDG